MSQNKEKLMGNLMGTDPEAFRSTILYMVYQTICKNDQITIRRLKVLLQNEYLISGQALDAAVSSLISSSGFAAVNRWLRTGNDIEDTKLCLLKNGPPEEFKTWMESVINKYPELRIFIPPVYIYKQQKVETGS